MKFELKIVPLDRASSKPVFPEKSPTVPTCMTFDLEAFAFALQVIPGFAHIGEDETNVSVFAQVLGEMLGADVYYRRIERDTDKPNDWLREPGVVPATSRYQARRAVLRHAQKVAGILELADHRALATDGPVDAPRFEGTELRELYVAATAIVKASLTGDN